MGKFARLAKTRGERYPAGKIVFVQGDKTDSMYLIYSGSFEVTREHDGKVVELGVLGPGDVFGEMALVGEKPRAATVKAVEDSILIPVSAAFFKENILKDPRFLFQIIETLILRIENTARSLKKSIADGVISVEVPRPADNDDTGPDMLMFLKIFRGYADPDKYFSFEKGEIIFSAGDMGDLMFIVLEGTVGITLDVGGEEQIIARSERGDFFGESALITDLSFFQFVTEVALLLTFWGCFPVHSVILRQRSRIMALKTGGVILGFSGMVFVDRHSWCRALWGHQEEDQYARDGYEEKNGLYFFVHLVSSGNLHDSMNWDKRKKGYNVMSYRSRRRGIADYELSIAD